MTESLVAISIEDSESNVKNVPAPEQEDQDSQDEQKKDETLLPLKMCYEWKEITQEFFEAVKGS